MIAASPPLEPSRPGIGLLLALLVAAAVWAATLDYLPALSLAVLIFVWRALAQGNGVPVLPLALTFQWSQVTAGMFYHHLTGRVIPELERCAWRPMVLVGLGCIVALTLGLLAGRRLLRNIAPREPLEARAPTNALAAMYLTLAIGTSVVMTVAFSIAGLTQIILTLALARYALLFMLFRRALRPHFRPGWFLLLLATEVVIGMTGFFAGFREAFMMAGLALLEVFDGRKIAHWAGAIGLVVSLAVVGLFWTGVKQDFRRSWRHNDFGGSELRKLDRIDELASAWASGDTGRLWDDADQLASRMWAVYYPALALARVPAVLPHTNGAQTARALQHILTPRLFFPEKEALESDSDLVRKYSGVWVAGRQQQTSIAFGYSMESYLDFGLPLMFVPVFLYALVLGLAHRGLQLRLRNAEISVGAISAIFWGALYLFERSWIKTIGMAVTSLLVLGGLALFLDGVFARLLARRALPVRLVTRPTKR